MRCLFEPVESRFCEGYCGSGGIVCWCVTYTYVLLHGIDDPVPKGECCRNLDDVCISSERCRILR